MTSPCWIVTRDRRDAPRPPRSRACVVRSLAERRVRDDERGDQLGGEHPLRPRRARRPSGPRAALGLGRPRCRGARSGASRRGRAPPRSGRRPSPRRRDRRGSSARPRRTGPARAVSRSDLRPSGLRSAENVVSIRRDPLLERDLLGGRDGDRVLGRVVVLAATAALAARAPPRSGPCSRSRARAARRCRACASWPWRPGAAPRAGCRRRGSPPGRGSGCRPRSPDAGCPRA